MTIRSVKFKNQDIYFDKRIVCWHMVIVFLSENYLQESVTCCSVSISDTSLRDGLFHEYKKHGKVTSVNVVGNGDDRYAIVSFKK